MRGYKIRGWVVREVGGRRETKAREEKKKRG